MFCITEAVTAEQSFPIRLFSNFNNSLICFLLKEFFRLREEEKDTYIESNQQEVGTSDDGMFLRYVMCLSSAQRVKTIR